MSSKKVSILIITKYFPPELTGSSTYLLEISKYLTEKGFSVRVLTTFPHFPTWKLNVSDKSKFFRKDTLEGVSVYRVYSFVPRKVTFLSRVFNEISFGFSCLIHSVFSKRFDIIFCVSPPPTTTIAGLYSKFFRGSKMILEIRDLVLEAINSTEKNKLSVSKKFIDSFERYIYRKSSKISVITEGFRDNLIKKGVSKDKIEYIPNWALLMDMPVKSESTQITKKELSVVYSGAIGKKDNIETIIEAAKLLRNEPIKFTIAGDGPKKNTLIELANRYELKNITFLPLQPVKEFQSLIQSADILVVSYYNSMLDFCLPSKVLTYLSSGKCLVALANTESEVGRLITMQENIAYLSEPENEEKLSEILKYLLHSPELIVRIGLNGKTFIQNEFNKEKILEDYKQLIFKN